MAIIATDTQRLSNLIKVYGYPTNPELHNDLVTCNEASITTYVVGTVLGKVTATGKFIVSKQAAVDGSQLPVAVVIGDSNGFAQAVTLAAATDTPILAVTRGAIVLSLGQIFLDASFGTAPQKLVAYNSLKAANILLENTI